MPLHSSTNYVFTSKGPRSLMTTCRCKSHHQSLSITECRWWYRRTLGWHKWTMNSYNNYGTLIVLIWCGLVFHQDRKIFWIFLQEQTCVYLGHSWGHKPPAQNEGDKDSSIFSTSFKAQLFGFPPLYSGNGRLFFFFFFSPGCTARCNSA